jgi:hypothetical protein
MVTPALTINPLVGVASVFQFDIFRTEELYRISPLARRQFAYPSAGVTAMLHVFAAASLVACTALAGRRLPPDSGLALEV